MLSSKSKSGFFLDVANTKNTPSSKYGRLMLDSKLAVSCRSTEISTTSNKLLKGSEQRLQLASLQENLKKAKKNLIFEKIEKASVLKKLSDAKKAVEVVSEKLGGSLIALKKAEENSEQSAIACARKREEKWHKEFENISNQHAVDVTTLVSSKKRELIQGLESSLHEVSMEARDLQERLLIKQAEVETVTSELDKLQLSLKITHETYEVVLDEAKYEIVCLGKTIEKSKIEAEYLKAQWDAKEISLRAAIEKADEEIALIKVERDQAKFHAKVAVEEANKLHHKKRLAKVSFKKKGENDKEHTSGNSEVLSEETWELIRDDKIDKFDDRNLAKLNRHFVRDGRISTIKQQLLLRKKKDLLNKIEELLKKKDAPK